MNKNGYLDVGDVILWNKEEWLVDETCWSGGGSSDYRFDYYPDGFQYKLIKLKNGKYDPQGQTLKKYENGTGCFQQEYYIGKYKKVRHMKKKIKVSYE